MKRYFCAQISNQISTGMSNICILGIKGAGKTVFISVLANRYREIRDGKPYMEFKNYKTNRYVSEVWDRLTKDRRWPDSTLPGSFEELEWTLHAPDGQLYGLRVLDAPGQDVQAIFSEQKSLSDEQKKLAAHIDAADCVVFLINLSCIVRAESAKERSDYEIPIVLAVKRLLLCGVRVAILFSQHDELRRDGVVGITIGAADKKTLISETVGMSAIEAVKKWLPAAYKVLKAQIDAKNSKVYVNFVAAVADTVSEVDECSISRNFPKENFGSYGLDEALAWMTASITSQKLEMLREWRKKMLGRSFLRWGVWSIGLFVIILVIGKGFVSCKEKNFLEKQKTFLRENKYEQEYRDLEKKKNEIGSKLGDVDLKLRVLDARRESIQNSFNEGLRVFNEEMNFLEDEKKNRYENYDNEKRLALADLEKERNIKKEEVEGKKREISSQEQKLKKLLDEVYFTKCDILHAGELSEWWNWDIDHEFWGNDDIHLKILERNWTRADLTITPDDEDLSIFSIELGFDGESDFHFDDYYDFKGKSAKARLMLVCRDFDQERTNREEYEHKMKDFSNRKYALDAEWAEYSHLYDSGVASWDNTNDQQKKKADTDYNAKALAIELKIDAEREKFTKEQEELTEEKEKLTKEKEDYDRKIHEEISGDVGRFRERCNTNLRYILLCFGSVWLVAWAIAAFRIFRKKEILS